MRAGRLNTRIKVLAPSTGKDAYGAPTTSAGTEVATLWAEKRDISGKERWASDHVINTSTVAFRVRYREDIEPEYQILHKGTTYQITGQPIDPDGRRTDLLITCYIEGV